MNSKGKGTGLALVIIMLAALLAAYLAVTQIGGLGFGNKSAEQQQNPVQQAQNVVDLINQSQQDALISIDP